METLFINFIRRDNLSKFINSTVVGIDISKDFHYYCIMGPKGDFYKTPTRINNNLEGYNSLIREIEKAKKRFNTDIPIFMESTSKYHETLLHFLIKNKQEAYLLNPLVTNSNKNINIRKAKNDKLDSKSIAKLAKYEDIKYTSYFDYNMANLKTLVRLYYSTVDECSKYKIKLDAYLQVFFPNYSKIFNDTCCKTSLEILRKYTTPQAIIDEDKEVIIDLLKNFSMKGSNWAEKKYAVLLAVAKEAIIIGIQSAGTESAVSYTVENIDRINSQLDSMKKEIEYTVNSEDFSPIIRESIDLIDSIPGFDFLSSVALISEIGDYSRFTKPKQLVAYLGIDPGVKQSGNYSSKSNRMSKRGSAFARRSLYAAALTSIRKKNNGEFYNHVLFKYYTENLKNKPKKVRLGAIMHKLVNYIYSILRDRKEFQIRDPRIHQQMFLQNIEKLAS